MRTLRILAFLSFAVVLHAQSRGKVAIVQLANSSPALDAIVKANAIEPVEIDAALPENLDEYDAIFFLANYSWPDSLAMDSTAQANLVKYIDNNGKLYIEGGFHIFKLGPFDSVSNPLFLRTGIEGYEDGSLSFPVDTLFGMESGFTSNISFGSFHDLNGIEDAGPYGSIIPVLFAGQGVGLSFPIAYISTDTSIRVVYGDYQDSYWPQSYYSEFITDVVCNYFNLCAESVPASSQASPSFSIVRDSREKGFSVSGSFTDGSKISVVNSLGMVLWQIRMESGSTTVELPANFSNGFYFVRIESANSETIKPLLVFN